MPKIKLSALATDIKGKSGGSVFSSNKGGTYFRNNPSGGGKKSQAWDAQKNKFGDLSKRWRNLSDPEKLAWENMASNYPFTNAFGEPYTASGFQLFMSLNGNLKSQDLPLLITPVMPRAINDIGVMNLSTPDLFLLNAGSRVNSFNGSNRGSQLYVSVDQVAGAPITELTTTISIIATVGKLLNNDDALSRYFPIFGKVQESDNSFSAVVSQDASNDWVLTVHLGTDEDYYEKVFKFFDDPRGVDYSYVIVLDIDGTGDISVYLDGELMDSDDIDVVGSPTGNVLGGGFVGYDFNKVYAMGTFSSFLQYGSVLSADDIELLYLGYIVANPLLAFDFADNGATDFVNYGTTGSAVGAEIIGYENVSRLFIPFSSNKFPKIEVMTENQGSTNTYIKFAVGKPDAGGKNAFNQAYKHVATFEFFGKDTFDITDSVKSYLGTLTGDGYLWVQGSLLDGDTGYSGASSIPPKKKIKFKAGSDLSSSVN